MVVCKKQGEKTLSAEFSHESIRSRCLTVDNVTGMPFAHRKRIHSSQEHLAVSDNALEQRANAP